MSATKASLAIRDVTVIAMTGEAALAHQTVLVENGRIAAIGPTDQIAVPPQASMIEGAGKYVIPGLIDMHVHIVPHVVMPRGEGEDAMQTSLDMAGEYLALFPRFGVTTVRNMAGSDFLLRVRKEAQSGRYPAPRILTSGPIIEQLFSWSGIATYAVRIETPQAARDEVRRQKDLGYDCLKIYNNTGVDVFNALMDEAAAAGMTVGGHIPLPVGLINALKAGIHTVEHLRGFDVLLDERPFHKRAPEHAADTYPGWRFTSPDRIAELADRVAEFPTGHVATMMVEDMECGDIVYPDSLLDQIPWSVKQHYAGLYGDLNYTPKQRTDSRDLQAARRQMLLELDRRDVQLLTGSDCPGAKTRLLPGFSLLQEIEMFVWAGITPYRALKAATVNPAISIGLQDEIGTLEVGKRADMVLLDADPLGNIAALYRQAGVVLNGAWFETGDKGASELMAWSETGSRHVARPERGAGAVLRAPYYTRA
ncbi:MAG: amidohydrolase family protein [Sphingobium sp.]